MIVTPMKVYEIVKDWVIKEYGLSDVEILRPFYPHIEYKDFEYKANQIVIDNPPFSILTQILDYYIENGVRFFLFAPHLTMLSINRKVCYIPADCRITYENGAKVNTGFITNLEECRIRTANDLREMIENCRGGWQKVRKI